jgi:undecaprenyl-diphosphatase
MQLWQLAILAIVQGLAELLPVSSSAHVIVAEKLLGLDPTAPQMTLLLVMLHTGTMFAVIAYFWRSWRQAYFSSAAAFRDIAVRIILATALTGVVGLALQAFIKHAFMAGASDFQIENLFGNAKLMAAALAAVGVLILVSSRFQAAGRDALSVPQAGWIGVVQGICLPFRGFSRSGATISTGLLRGLRKDLLEDFSFALAVVLTPAVIVREGHRLLKAQHLAGSSADALGPIWPCLVGMLLSFAAGWLSLKWLSRWLEHGRWHLFGYYCLFAALVVFIAGKLIAGPAA